MTTETSNKKSKFIAYMLLVFGVLRLADWLYGGRTDLGDAMAGIGFLLMSPAAFAEADPEIASRFHTSGKSSILKPLSYLGAALAVIGILMGWL
jgi:uncharacterized membrane protein YkgB